MLPDPLFLELQDALAGRYSLERELGRGGMGIVYLAREIALDRQVAIKVLAPRLANDAGMRERFLREARVAASLAHPNIVPIYSVSEVPAFPYFVMQFVDGETLGGQLRRRGPMAAAAAQQMLRELAWALAYAHGRGVIHRDVKPDNILMERGTDRALLSDFGIATERSAAGSADVDVDRVLGTAHFMSPEQSGRAAVDGRSDLYSLGAVGYVALSGRLPFEGATLAEFLIRQARDTAPSLSLVAPSAPRHLIEAIDICLRTSPSERFASAELLTGALSGPTALRPALPPVLREWVDARNPRALVHWLVSAGSLYGATRLPGAALYLTMLAFYPLVLTVIGRGRSAQRVLEAGFSIADMRLALDVWKDERAELDVGSSPEGDRVGRALRGMLGGLWAGVAVARVIVHRSLPPEWGALAALSLWFGGLTLLLTFAVDVPLLSQSWSMAILGAPSIGSGVRRMLGTLRRRFWSSRAGDWFLRSVKPAGMVAPASFAHRPTEVALGVAVEELYKALPEPYREQLGDLPAVVRRLEAHARRARARIALLDRGEAPGKAGIPVTGSDPAARGRPNSELAEAIGALETIRLQLLRLHGGAANLEPLTTALDAAVRAGEDLDRLDKAQREVGIPRRPRLGLDARTPTPA